MTRDTGDELPGQQALGVRAESLQAAMAERYRKLFEFAPVGIVYSDPEGYYLDANDTLCRMLGFTRAEFIGLHARDIIAPVQIPRIQNALEEINRQAADYQREWTFRRKDGSTFDAEVSVTKFADGTLLGMIRDITQQVEQEREIARLTRLYDALSQINQAIVWTTERDELLRKVCQVLVERGGFRMAWIGWHDAAGQRLVPVAKFGDDGDYTGRITVYTDDRPEARGPSGTAFRTGKPYVSNDLLQEPATVSWRPELKRSGFLASASFPIRLAGEVYGTLNVYAEQRDVFHDKEVELLEEAATDISFALDNFARDEARRQAELTLRHEKQFSDMMMESMPGMVYLYGLGGKLLRWNQNFEKVLGYSSAELVRLSPLDLVPPEDRPATVARIARLQAAHAGSGEVRVLTKDGKTIPYFFSRQLVTYDGQDCLVGVGIDLSERKRAEEGRARLTRLIENSQDFIALADLGGRLTFMNQAGRSMIGLEGAADLGELHYTDYIAADWQSFFRDTVLASVRDRGSWEGEMQLRHLKTGDLIDVYRSNFVIYDEAGKPDCLATVTRDITTSKRSLAALHLRDRAIQSVSQGILITDPNQPDNPIIFAGAGFERITGYRPADVAGMNCRFMQGRDTDRETVRQLREAVSAQRTVAVELLNYRKDGAAFWNALSLSPVHDEAGALQYFVGIQADITARKVLEDQLRQSQKMEAIGQLAGGVAHDFNNLLTVIGSYSALLISMPDVGEQVHGAARAIGEAGERAAALTRQLLGFSRRTMLQPKVLDLNAHVAETGSMLRRLIGEDVLIATTLAPDLGRIKVDPAQLDQVLMNLAVNARDAMPRGGRLTIETANFLITEEYAATHVDCKAGPHVMLALTDTGSGIPAEVMPRIFDPFFTTKESGKGTGLGLATVLGIVQQSGGRILCYSEPGHGTTFKIYFPAVAGEVVGTSEAAAMPEVTGSETILLVEDDESVREVALLSLQMHGFHVITAEDGKDALRVAAEYQGSLDLLLTDVVMPNLSGADLAKTLCRQFPKLKVLFMSGYTNDAAVRHGLLDASVAFIQKPYTPQGLARKVRAVLDEQTLGGS